MKATERQEHQQRQAQRDIEALPQALHDVGLPDDLVIAIEGRLRVQKKRLGTIFGRRFPTLFGCRSAHELTRGRGWDTQGPSRILGALPTRSWLKRLRQLGQAILSVWWRHVESMRAATRSRWQWTWVWDATVLRTDGQALALGGTWDRGQHTRVVHGLEGVWLLVVIGEGPLVVPVDFAGRRPAPKGPGARCRTTRGWAQGMRDDRVAARSRRGLPLPAPLVVAERWCSDATVMAPVAATPPGTMRVHGKTPDPLTWHDGRKVTGADLIHAHAWPWRQSLNAPGCRSARLRATSPT
jgi:hypothetical protein